MTSVATVDEEDTESDSQSEDAFRVITGGASLYIVGRTVDQVLRFVTNILLTNFIGAALYGIYTYGYLLFSVFLVFTKAGTGKSLLKLLPQYEENSEQQDHLFSIASATIFTMSILLSPILYFSAPYITAYTLQEELLVEVLQIFAFFLPFYSFSKLVTDIFKSLENPRYQVFIDYIADPVIRLVAIGTAIAIGLSLIGIVSFVLAGGVLLTTVAGYLLFANTNLRPRLDATSAATSEFYRVSFPLMFNQAGAFLYNRVDVLLVGLFFSGVSVGIYNISMILATALSLPLVGFCQLFPPIASRLYSNGDIKELESLYRRVTRWIITLSLPPSLVFLIYPEEVLSIFGPEFTAGALILILFAIAQLVNAAVGPSGYILIMTDNENIATANQAILGASNLILTYYFLQIFGLIGAALASAGVLACVNLFRIAEVWYLERLFPYSYRLYKPIIAGLAATVTMVACKFVAEGLLLVFLGGAIGLIAFFGVLVWLGIEGEDIELFRTIVGGS